ncbi:branchpoint-bridging protein-like isoform X2 [Nymphaea colorata]|nr:branchpoint-bridging protein-like [Nymphaea colorata]XP_049934359.1 branchpoint-bridging protein-like [Nymphaea colorata]XP_049935785.1 branchpoint-bridging protein-like [Nymphaea colorata]XP_049936711.1 branchpoint-bridging protein-like isoform X1 [Nymphaea colorata]XP_049936712.1 branchpoint-bridging protein-like isoform X2 [Nymphaea colorata]
MARCIEEDWARTQKDHQKKASQHSQGGRTQVKRHHFAGRTRPYERRDDRTFRRNQPTRSEATQGSVATPTSQRCPTCSRVHPGKPCYREIGACLHCGRMGHFIKDCPLRKERELKKPEAGPSSARQTTGRVYATTVEELQAHDLVEGFGVPGAAG